MGALTDRATISPNVTNTLDETRERVSVSRFAPLNLSFALIGDLAISTILQRGMHAGFKRRTFAARFL